MNFIISFFFTMFLTFGAIFVYDSYQGRTLAASLGDAIIGDIMKLKESTCKE